MAMTLDDLVAQLQKVFAAGLRSVVLYGSSVAGEHLARRSDYNVLVILDSIPLDRLPAAGAVLQSWGEAGNPAPMIFTLQEWKSSPDVFPMEYSDILEHHRVLYGEDPCAGIEISRTDLRLQVEQQALGKLLHLRRGAMAAGADRAAQLELLADALSTLMVIFRGVVRLHGRTPPQDYAALAREVAADAGFDATPFTRVVLHARGAEKLSRHEATEVLGGCLTGMEALVRYLDAAAT